MFEQCFFGMVKVAYLTARVAVGVALIGIWCVCKAIEQVSQIA